MTAKANEEDLCSALVRGLQGRGAGLPLEAHRVQGALSPEEGQGIDGAVTGEFRESFVHSLLTTTNYQVSPHTIESKLKQTDQSSECCTRRTWQPLQNLPPNPGWSGWCYEALTFMDFPRLSCALPKSKAYLITVF